MPALESRLRKLESASTEQRVVVVGSNSLSDDIPGFLAANGIDTDDHRNQIVVFKTLYEDQAGNVVDTGSGPFFFSKTETAHRRLRRRGK